MMSSRVSKTSDTYYEGLNVITSTTQGLPSPLLLGRTLLLQIIGFRFTCTVHRGIPQRPAYGMRRPRVLPEVGRIMSGTKITVGCFIRNVLRHPRRRRWGQIWMQLTNRWKRSRLRMSWRGHRMVLPSRRRGTPTLGTSG